MFLDLPIGSLHEPLTGQTVDARGCVRRAIRRAEYFADRSVKPGDTVLLHYGNRIEFFIDIAACWLAGACAAPVDPRLSAFEVEALVGAVKPRLSVWDRNVDSTLAQKLTALGTQPVDHASLAAENATLRFGGAFPRMDDSALMLFTSGTTGQPKAVVHTHRSLRARLSHQRNDLGLAPYRRTLCALPTNFAWGLVGNSLFPWLTGQSLFIVPAFRPDIMLRLGVLCDEQEITCLPSVPSMWKTVLRTSAPPRRQTLRLVPSGTGPLPLALWHDVQKWSGIDAVANIYGLTECGWIAGHNAAEAAPLEGSVGKPYGSVLRILPAGTTSDEIAFAEPCPPGQTGHVWTQTPALMRGYAGRDDLTAQVITRGWFMTGDLGVFDDSGALVLKGRDKDMINVAGVKVYPADLDTLLGRNEAVADACAFGVQDALQGEQVGVAVVLHETHRDRFNELYEWTRQHLAQYQLPKAWYIVADIPRTARGKLSRTQIADLCAKLTPVDIRAIERTKKS